MRRGYRVIFAILQRAGLRNGAILRKTSMYGGFMSPDFLLARDLPIMAAVQRSQETLLHFVESFFSVIALVGDSSKSIRPVLRVLVCVIFSVGGLIAMLNAVFEQQFHF